MTAVDRLDAWLRISPSTVLPAEVLEYLDDVKAENAKLRDELEDQEGYDQMLRDRLRQQTELCVKAKTENAKLRDWCSELLHMAESNDPDFLHWPEIHDELRKLGVKIVKL